jgi:diaminopimelate decarboxylase
MTAVSSFIQKYFKVDQNELSLGDLPISKVLRTYETPIFLYDRSVLDKKLQFLKKTLPKEFEVFYSVKANPNQTFLKYFLANGCGLEIASEGELQQALKAGCSPERILFAGPGKTDSELELSLKSGVGEFHVESLSEIDRLGRLASRMGVTARVAVRVNPDGQALGGAMQMGGKPSPFGIDEEMLDLALEQIFRYASLKFTGIHLFTGTQILDYLVLIRQYQKGLEIAKRAAVKSKSALATVDFGGGWGIPYFQHENEIDIDRLTVELESLFAEVRKEPCFSGTRFILELGRYLVGEAGVYVTRVTNIKHSRGKKYLIVDGGMNHHLAASGNLGQIVKRNFPVSIVNKVESPAKENVDVVGPLCTPLDMLARDIALPEAECGDFVGVFQSGAYARTSSPLGFLSRPAPAEVWVEDGKAVLIRRGGCESDYFHDQPAILER